MSMIGGFAAMAGIDITSATQEEVREAFHKGRDEGYIQGWNARDLDYQNLEYKYQELSNKFNLIRDQMNSFERLYQRCNKRYELLNKADDVMIEVAKNRAEKGDKVLQVVGEMGQSENLTTTWKENHPEDWQNGETLVLDTKVDELMDDRRSVVKEIDNV